MNMNTVCADGFSDRLSLAYVSYVTFREFTEATSAYVDTLLQKHKRNVIQRQQ